MKVLIADKFEESGMQQLRALGCEVTYQPGVSGLTLTEAVRETACNVLIVRSTRVPRETVEASPTLALIIRAGSGWDTIDVQAATDRDIRVCNCPGMNSVAVAELTIGFMIALDRRIVDETDDLRRRVWNKKEYSNARGLAGRTLGIVGLGRIGYEVAKRAASFEMHILYSDLFPRPDMERSLNMRRVKLPELLGASDFITLHVTGGPQTHHLIGEAEFAKMKPTAYLINCSRGGVVDENALSVAIERGEIAGAALDVFEVEPTASEAEFLDPVVTAPRLYGTHHVGASTEQAQAAVAAETVRIVRKYMETGDCLHCVNPSEHALA